MSSPRNPASGRGHQELYRSLQNLQQEPETDKDEGINFEEQRDENDRDENDDPRQREEAHIASEHARNRAGSPQCRNERRRIEKEMRDRGGDATGDVENEISAVTQPVLDGRSEQPERPHVENEMQPSSVQEHHREQG